MCSKPPYCEVICSLRHGGGLRPRVFTGRGLPSSRLLFLGSDAWRSPANGAGGAQELHCKNFFGFRVLFVKRKALSLDRIFPRASCARSFLHITLVENRPLVRHL
jgi:hypothetical protein